jgi:hypothetical protein
MVSGIFENKRDVIPHHTIPTQALDTVTDDGKKRKMIWDEDTKGIIVL